MREHMTRFASGSAQSSIVTDSVGTTLAAELCHISKGTLKRAATRGEIASWQTPGGHRRYLRVDVDAFAASLGQATPATRSSADLDAADHYGAPTR